MMRVAVSIKVGKIVPSTLLHLLGSNSHEPRKVVKYNHLVANMIILHNEQDMSRAIKQL